MQTAGNQQQRSQKKKTRRPAHGQHSAEPGTAGGSPTERGASRGPRGLREYNLQVLGGIIGQPHRDLRPQGAATQSTGAGCIVHPTQVHAFAVRASYPRALSCSLYTVPWTRGWWSRPTDRPSGGDQGWNSITDSRGGIFIAEVTSIHPHSPRPGSRELLLRALVLPLLSPSLSFSRHPPARPSFRLCLATSFFFLHPWDLHLLHRTFSRSPLILPSLSPHNQTISNPGRVTSLSAGLLPCPINPVSTLDPRSSRPCNPQYKIALLPTWPR